MKTKHTPTRMNERQKIIQELNENGYHTIDKKDSTSHLRSLLGIYQSKEKQSLVLESHKGLRIFVNEVLPQAGKLCFNVGNLNDSLIKADKALKQVVNL